MMNIMHFYEAGKALSGRVLIPFFDTVNINNWRFSTRHGNAKVKWGDGNETDYVLTKNTDYTSSNDTFLISHTYATAYTGDVEVIFKQGLRDVYSINVVDWSKGTNNGLNEQINKINIQDFGTYIKKFSNLYSYFIDTYSYQTPSAQPIIKGNLADIPASVERISIATLEVVNASVGDVYFNFNSLGLNSKLKYFLFTAGANTIQSNLKFIGNIGNLPVGCTFFKAQKATSNSAITYTAGKVWASSFDTLSIPLALTTAELDNLLIDMDNSIATKIGDGVISLGGYRSATSDAAVASLQAKGFMVNVNRKSKILDLPFQNSFVDSGEMAMTMVAGGTSNQPTFALSGRKAGEYCAVFNGSQSIKTTTNLPINSDKITIAFWIKTTQTTTSAMLELSANYSGVNGFAMFLNDIRSGKIELGSGTSSVRKFVDSSNNVNSGAWMHIVGVIDRAVTPTSVKIYVDGIDVTTLTSLNSNNTGNFTSQILFIGQRAGSSLGFNGSLTKLKLYNYPLTAGEVSTLYNSEL